MLIELALAHNHYILPAAQGCVHVGADPDLFTASTCFGSVGAIDPVCGKKPEHLLVLWDSVCRQWYSVPLADSDFIEHRRQRDHVQHSILAGEKAGKPSGAAHIGTLSKSVLSS